MSSDENNRIIAMRARGMIGVQFHPESVMTENGYDLLKEYLIALSSA
jgi:anthranilate/para-aminobenzoate synthase component II